MNMRRPLPPLTIAFCAGAALRLGTAVPIWLPFVAALVCMTVLFLSRETRFWPVWALALVVCAGAVRTCEWAGRPADSVTRLSERKWARLHGTIVADPVRQPWGTVFDLDVATAESMRGSEPASGRVRVTVPTEIRSNVGYGDRVSVLGRVRLPDDAANPAELPPAQYLRRDGIVCVTTAAAVHPEGQQAANPLVAVAIRSRHVLESGIRATLPRLEGALLTGLLFSDTSALPLEVQNDFARAGTVHILSTSGLHVVLLAWLLSVMLPARRPAAKRWRAALLLAALVFFALMTGLRPAVVRAVVMTGVVLAAPLFDREPDTWSALACALLCLVVASPGNLLDPGFQLSFAAAIALALWFDRRSKESKTRGARWLRDSVQTSVVASAATAPLAARYFGTFSIASPLTNLLTVPVLGPAMGLGLIQGATWANWPQMARIAGAINRPILHWMLWVTHRIGGSSWSATDVGAVSWPVVMGSYAIMALVWAILRRWPCEGRLAGLRTRVVWSIAGVAMTTLVAYLAWGPLPPLRVTFFDVGQGDCTLIQTPGGRNVLIDAGGRYESGTAVGSDIGQRIILPALRRAGVKRLDLVVLTHPHEDHAGGLPSVFTSLPVGLWMDSGQIHAAPGYHGAHLVARDKHIPFRLGRTGDTIDLEPGVRLEVLAPSRPLLYGTRDDLNNNSIVCRLQYGETAFLLAGDSEFEEEARELSVPSDLKADVLKAGHHGSATSSSPRFLKAVSPRWAIVSCGRHNRYGHPNPGTIERLHEAGARVFRTDLDGGIVAQSDGHGVQVATSRWQLP